MVHILDGLFVLLLVILFAVFVDNGNDDYIFVLLLFAIIFYSIEPCIITLLCLKIGQERKCVCV